MAKTLKPTHEDRCNGCEMCVFESQRQLNKVGLEESLIRVFRKKTDNSTEREFNLEIDPRISALNLDKIESICPRNVFEVGEDS